MNLSIDAVLPAMQMGRPSKTDGYLIVARDLLPTVEAIAALEGTHTRGCAMLAAQALECALKALLEHQQGVPKAVMGDHNLLDLWAHAYGPLGLSPTPPDWVSILAVGHGPNFYFRYQKGVNGTIVHGGSTPALVPMATELRAILEAVVVALKN